MLNPAGEAGNLRVRARVSPTARLSCSAEFSTARFEYGLRLLMKRLILYFTYCATAETKQFRRLETEFLLLYFNRAGTEIRKDAPVAPQTVTTVPDSSHCHCLFHRSVIVNVRTHSLSLT